MNISRKDTLKSGLIGISIGFLYNLFILTVLNILGTSPTSSEMYNLFLYWTFPSFIVGCSINIVFAVDDRSLVKSYIISYIVTAIIITIFTTIFWRYTGDSQFIESILIAVIANNLLILSGYLITAAVYYVYELAQLHKLNKKLENNAHLNKLVTFDKIATGIIVPIICIFATLMPVATSGDGFFSFLGFEFSTLEGEMVSLYLLELSYGIIIALIILISSIATFVLSILGVISKNVILNIIGITILALAMIISFIFIMISSSNIDPNLSLTIWPWMQLLFGLASLGDAYLFTHIKKYM